MAADNLLEIEGIKGESKDKQYPHAIEVSSFSWGESNAGSMASGTGGGTGKVSFSDMSFSAATHKGSPLLAQHCANGKHIPKATLYVRKQGEEQQVYYKIELHDMIVTHYQSSGSEGGGIPHESFSLNFAKIKWVYKHQNADGTLGAEVPFTWNLKENTK